MPEITQKMGFDAASAISNLSKLTGKLNEANTALNKLQQTKGGSAALDKVEKSTKKAKKGTESFLVSWQTMARILATQIVVRGLNTVIQGLKDSVEQARLLGLAIEEVRTIDSAGRGALDLSDQILDLSDAIGKAPVDLAEGLYQTLSNQVVEAGEALNFTSTAAKLATVTASQTGDAVNALSSVMNSYGLAAGEAQHVSDTLFKTVELGRLRLNEIANVIGRVTPLTAALGIAWEEVAASLATMTRQGVRADTAITQLRAVVTRLIKPTDEMRAIFHKWGVEDGKQAISTFGGLSGVLKKLAQETGGSSEGMAELLRNVRAISGAMGIMNGEGETMEEILKGITNSADDAGEAWSQFAESDAQKLTKSMQEFSNTLTRVGSENLPSVITAMEFINDLSKAYIQIAKEITGNWGEADVAAGKYAEAVKAGTAAGDKVRADAADSVRGLFDNLTNASDLYYAEANKKEFALRKVRDDSIDIATAALKAAGKTLTDFYDDNLKAIKKFGAEAASSVEESFRKISQIRQDVEDQALQFALDNEEDKYRKFKILEDAFGKQQLKRNKARAAVTADPETLKAAETAQKRLLSLDVQRLRAAEDAELGEFRIKKLQQSQLETMRQGINIQQGSIDVNKLAIKAQEALTPAMEQTVARLDEIKKRSDELHKDGLIDPEERVELDALNKEWSKLNQLLGEANEVMKTFGLDTKFGEIVNKLTDALNAAEKNWDAEVDRFRVALEKQSFELDVFLDPSGIRAQLREALGIEALPGETAGARSKKVDVAAGELLEREAIVQGEVNGLIAEGAGAMQGLEDVLVRIGDLQSENNVKLHDALMIDMRRRTNLDGRAAKEAAINEMLAGRTSALNEVQTKYAAILDLSSKGQVIDAAVITDLMVQSRQLLLNKKITEDQLSLHDLIRQGLVDRNALNAKITAKKKELPEKEQIVLARELELRQLGIAEAQESQETVAQNLATFQERQKTAADGTEISVREMEQALVAAHFEAEGTANSAEAIGTNTAGSIPAIHSATTAASALADQFARARAEAAAINSSGGGGPQTVRNPFRAEGGPITRGSDTQLASLTPGETVTNKRSSQQFFSELNAINQGKPPVFREQGGSVTTVGDVNVTVNGGGSSQQTMREIGHGLRREIQRGNIKLR